MAGWSLDVLVACHHPLAWQVLDISRADQHGMQALTPGGTVSHHLMLHAPCPVLVLPYRALGLAESLPQQRGDMSPDEIVSPRDGGGNTTEDTDGLSAARLRLAKMSAPVGSEHELMLRLTHKLMLKVVDTVQLVCRSLSNAALLQACEGRTHPFRPMVWVVQNPSSAWSS